MIRELKKKPRTLSQNNAMHLLFTQIADELNSRGIEQKLIVELLEKYATVPWNSISVKEIIWRTLQKALLLRVSTKELTTQEVDQVFEVMNREVFVPLGIELPFPSIEEVMRNDR